ncbi:MAG: hypothetical protein KC657_34460, partial [Myxococcales bacterium]|nr:hypothetical protein [Myxococcales bacterium]
ACVEGQTRCEGDLVSTCAVGPGGEPAFSPAVACAGDAVCKGAACVEPTAGQRAQAAELLEVVGYLQGNTAWHGPLDWARIRDDGKRRIFRGDGGELDYFTALFHAFIAVPQGHQGLYAGRACGKLVPMPGFAQRGACGRPHPRGVIVTQVAAGNALGLAKGDLIVGLGAARGDAVLAELSQRPSCATSRPGASFTAFTTATTFSDLVRPGEKLEVESPDGAVRAVTVPDGALSGDLQKALFCQDPFGRDTRKPVESELRPDGVGVIRLPGFTDPEQPFPTSGNPADIDAYQAKFEDKIQAAFDAVKTARAIVWDVRGNGGGLTRVGLDIASGFPGAQAGDISYCQARIPESDPPAFDTFKYATYALAPGGRFAYAGKVAVLIDGLDYSAADYFPLAVKTKTSAILVGAPTAGGFGATSATRDFKGPPSFSVSVDLNRCSAAADDTPLEGRGVTPHVAAEYDPKDVAAGRDSILERAVRELDAR